MIKLAITENTEALLASRMDDYRIALIHDVLFSDDFSGSHPERKFDVADLDGKETSYTLRKADIFDSLGYEKVPSVNDMRVSIEQNISAIQRMKKNGNVPGMLSVKDVWVILFTTNKDGEDLQMNTYFNPDATDCSEILKSERSVVLTAFIISYPTKTKPEDKIPEGYPDELLEFTFLSPLDTANLAEYRSIALEEEAKQLQNAFLIKFNTGM